MPRRSSDLHREIREAADAAITKALSVPEWNNPHAFDDARRLVADVAGVPLENVAVDIDGTNIDFTVRLPFEDERVTIHLPNGPT